MTVKTPLTAMELDALGFIQRDPVGAAKVLTALWESRNGCDEDQMEAERGLRLCLDEHHYSVFHRCVRRWPGEAVCSVCGEPHAGDGAGFEQSVAGGCGRGGEPDSEEGGT